MMTTKSSHRHPGGPALRLSFDLAYDIETEWDFMWVQVSDDSGTTWKTLTNTNTTARTTRAGSAACTASRMTCAAAGLGGFTDYNANCPAPETETFDLSAVCRPEHPAALLVHDRLGHHLHRRRSWTTSRSRPARPPLFSDDAESGDANWTYAAPWERSNGTQTFTHNFYLQWRNVNANGGYDSALGDPRWRFGPANTGLLVWYNNNFYSRQRDLQLPDRLPRLWAQGPHVGGRLAPRAVPRPGTGGGRLQQRGRQRDAPLRRCATRRSPCRTRSTLRYDGLRLCVTTTDSLRTLPAGRR